MSSPDPRPHDDRIELIVLFGGQSAEATSAAPPPHVLRAADPARYRITPIGIDR
ncbi:MAG: hypothetical protein R2713_16070 [Ilumatobacteraceae bacterium]